MRPEEKIGHCSLTYERTLLYIMDLIWNDWKHILRKKLPKNLFSKLFARKTKTLGK